jgi:large subunit ribosomal protein L1
VNFTAEALLENIRALMVGIGNAKPEGAKGKYIKSVYVSSTMGIGAAIDAATVDPRSPRFMQSAAAATKGPMA